MGDYDESVIQSREEVDSPLASEISWTPQPFAETPFRLKRLTEKSARRIEISPAPAAFVFPLIFLIMGIGLVALTVLGFLYPEWLKAGHRNNQPSLIAALVGILFIPVGLALAKVLWRRVVFDKETGKVRGLRGSDRQFHEIALSEAAALQWLTVNGTTQLLYLVTRQGERYAVTQQPGPRALGRDASALAAFLDLLVWKDEVTVSAQPPAGS